MQRSNDKRIHVLIIVTSLLNRIERFPYQFYTFIYRDNKDAYLQM